MYPNRRAFLVAQVLLLLLPLLLLRYLPLPSLRLAGLHFISTMAVLIFFRHFERYVKRWDLMDIRRPQYWWGVGVQVVMLLIVWVCWRE